MSFIVKDRSRYPELTPVLSAVTTTGVAPEKKARKVIMLKMLADYRKLVEADLVTRLGIICDHQDGRWGTSFSHSDDCSIDATLLMEIAIRKSGLASATAAE